MKHQLQLVTTGHSGKQYFNDTDVYRIDPNDKIRPYLHHKHCWFEAHVYYKNKLYALTTLILGGGEQKVKWLIPHHFLRNISVEANYD